MKQQKTARRAKPVTGDLSPRATETLNELGGNHINGFVSPMMVGGTDASHHSATLGLLVRRGFAERRRRGTLINEIGGGRGSWEYRITSAGRAKLKVQP